MTPLHQWRRYLSAPVDGASLAAFRVLFGAIMLWEVLRYVAHGRIARYYIEPPFLFGFVPCVKPWGGYGMYLHFALLGVLSVFIACGLFYRIAASIFCVAFAYVFLLDKAQYLNHLYLVCLVSFLMALLPANRVFSVDRRLFFPGAPGAVPRYSLLILRAQVIIVYFFGGIAKINADWLRGEPIGAWLAARSDLPLIGPLLTFKATALLFAYGGLLIDLSVGPLLCFRRTFKAGAALAVFFNVLNAILFSIGIFPYFMIASLSLFPDPGWPRRVWRRISKVPRDEAPEMARDAPMSAAPVSAAPMSAAPVSADRGGSAGEAALVALLHVYLLVQLAVPLRHWFYPGDVAWNEDGHRFSWRMKLRDKDILSFTMFVVDPRTGVREEIEPHAWITERQLGKMVSRPDMVVQLARHIADHYEASTGVRPAVNAEIHASLHGGPIRNLIDPTVDLASPTPAPLHPPP